jgi:hypothetical protein
MLSGRQARQGISFTRLEGYEHERNTVEAMRVVQTLRRTVVLLPNNVDQSD